MSANHIKSSNVGGIKKQVAVSNSASLGRADLARLRSMTEEEIMRTSPPELANLPDDFWDDAEWVLPTGKEPISLRVDTEILEWYRAQGPRYQTRMNAVLRSYMVAMQRKHSSQRAPKKRAK